jgi:hypothetical protein
MFSSNTSQVSEDRLYVEDVFSTYLYAGTSGAQSINNGIDTLNKGGLVWLKNRTSALSNILLDTGLGCTFSGGSNLISNSTNAAGTIAANTFKFDSTGFSFGSAATGTGINGSGSNYVSWTFRKAPKFFDVVTYTGDGTGDGRTIAHNLGVEPGCIIVKKTSATGYWATYHRGAAALPKKQYAYLNTTDAFAEPSGLPIWGATATTFSVNQTYLDLNANGATYVAYLFAHDTASDGIIQCGSFTTDGSGNATVNLGWEPQFVITKESSTTGFWKIADNMRGWTDTELKSLRANSTLAEQGLGYTNGGPTATGFKPAGETANATFIYIAIRRGPMRTPTTGTSVFAPVARTGTSAGASVSSGFTTDLAFIKTRNSVENWDWEDRLRGSARYISSNATSAEAYAGTYPGGTIYFDTNNGVNLGADSWVNGASTYVNYFFRRAPSFFDVVCYTGTGVAGQTISHNLGVAPELIIIKKRNAASTLGWAVGTTFAASTSDQLFLNTTDAASQTTYNGFITSKPTATAFNVSAYTDVGASAQTYVAYLFASCPGVSKVGTYTGNGSSQTINCGFAAGARFVMIKRASAAGDWYVWDSARGIVSGNDPRLSLNTTAAEVTTDDSVDTDSSGFVVNQLSATNINVSSATYLYMAVA